jgi:hypothetical protein
VRIAFIEAQEQGVRLPIILDETLANSDDSRADAIVRTVLELCGDDRQVFYLTAQEDEVLQWKKVLGTGVDLDHRLIALRGRHVSEIGVSSGSAVGDGVPAVLVRDVPAPEGRNHAAYGRVLDVEPWNPYAPVGSLHLWYLIEDVRKLHALLEAGYERWGQLQGLIRDGDASFVGLDGESLDRLELRAAAVRAWRQAWLIGRGQPVDQSVLESSGAVSDKFIESVAALGEEVSFEGKEIISALRDGAVSGFFSSKMDELEEWLIDNGYVDPSDPLAAGEIWTRTLGAVSERMQGSTLDVDDLKRLIARLVTPSRTAGPSEE